MQTVPEMSENQENYSFASASIKQTAGNIVKNQSITSFKKHFSDTDGMTFTEGENDEEKSQNI